MVKMTFPTIVNYGGVYHNGGEVFAVDDKDKKAMLAIGGSTVSNDTPITKPVPEPVVEPVTESSVSDKTPDEPSEPTAPKKPSGRPKKADA